MCSLIQSGGWACAAVRTTTNTEDITYLCTLLLTLYIKYIYIYVYLVLYTYNKGSQITFVYHTDAHFAIQWKSCTQVSRAFYFFIIYFSTYCKDDDGGEKRRILFAPSPLTYLHLGAVNVTPRTMYIHTQYMYIYTRIQIPTCKYCHARAGRVLTVVGRRIADIYI